ncbi:Cytochrome c-type biogenesis protein CcmE [Vitis vinifera]|uniref:Cytochrome c-type biogenesis protein CcmE n=1 Tax=Vitis vinifera TaxID=29760 RepID=A0A438HLT9_VITVI|nr:Cytochrome c-type biogenesis protein CcmE [Vitis vinifera]
MASRLGFRLGSLNRIRSPVLLCRRPALPVRSKTIDIGARARQLQNRRLWTYALSFSGSAAIIVIVLYQFQDQMVFCVTPTEALEDYAANSSKNKFRLGGLVLEGSVMQPAHSPDMEFVVTDLITDILVRYQGALPDLFREGHSVVVEGFVKPFTDEIRKEVSARSVSGKARSGDYYFSGIEVLAKHDEKYMPKEVAEAIERNKRNSQRCLKMGRELRAYRLMGVLRLYIALVSIGLSVELLSYDPMEVRGIFSVCSSPLPSVCGLAPTQHVHGPQASIQALKYSSKQGSLKPRFLLSSRSSVSYCQNMSKNWNQPTRNSSTACAGNSKENAVSYNNSLGRIYCHILLHCGKKKVFMVVVVFSYWSVLGVGIVGGCRLDEDARDLRVLRWALKLFPWGRVIRMVLVGETLIEFEEVEARPRDATMSEMAREEGVGFGSKGEGASKGLVLKELGSF